MTTRAQQRALKWLRNRNADGLFDKYNVLVAAGERTPVMRSTWAVLEQEGLVERYGNKNQRVRVTALGLAMDLSQVEESKDQSLAS